jgi:hypothetical protein
VLGGKWGTELSKYFLGADVIIGIELLILIGLYFYHHIKSDWEYAENNSAASRRGGD